MHDTLAPKQVGVTLKNANGVVAAHFVNIAVLAPRGYAAQSARQAMSRRQKPPGQSIRLTAA